MVEKKRYIHWQQRFREQGPQLLIPILSLALILATAHGAARLSWRLFDLIRPSQEKVIATTGVKHNGSADTFLSEKATPDKELIALHLFGQASGMPGAAQPAPRHLPQTTLNLALIGVIYNSSPEKGVAIIQEKDSTEEADIYGVGDQLPGNSVLREIQTDRVILVRAGNQEVLPLDEGSLAPAAGTANENKPTVEVPRRGGMRARGMKARRNQQPIQPHDNGDDDGASMNIDRGYLNQRLANLKTLSSEIKTEAYQVGGDQQGYRLQAGDGSTLLGQLGLKNGDVLTEVNGMPLRSSADVMQAYKELKNAENIQVQFIRDGTEQTMDFNIGQIQNVVKQ